jgi:hypothetical protein
MPFGASVAPRDKADRGDNEGFRPSPLPPVCPARLPARRPSVTAVDLLARINTHVHDEVRRLHPDAEFPHFDVERPPTGGLALVYRSRRGLADLAEGLIRGCIAHFGDQVSLERHDSPGDAEHQARFVLSPCDVRR